jgi:hypothetical protein
VVVSFISGGNRIAGGPPAPPPPPPPRLTTPGLSPQNAHIRLAKNAMVPNIVPITAPALAPPAPAGTIGTPPPLPVRAPVNGPPPPLGPTSPPPPPDKDPGCLSGLGRFYCR